MSRQTSAVYKGRGRGGGHGGVMERDGKLVGGGGGVGWHVQGREGQVKGGGWGCVC